MTLMAGSNHMTFAEVPPRAFGKGVRRACGRRRHPVHLAPGCSLPTYTYPTLILARATRRAVMHRGLPGSTADNYDVAGIPPHPPSIMVGGEDHDNVDSAGSSDVAVRRTAAVARPGDMLRIGHSRLQADIQAAVNHHLGGESLVAVRVVRGFSAAPGTVEICVPAGWEFRPQDVWPVVLKRVPAGLRARLQAEHRARAPRGFSPAGELVSECCQLVAIAGIPSDPRDSWDAFRSLVCRAPRPEACGRPGSSISSPGPLDDRGESLGRGRRRENFSPYSRDPLSILLLGMPAGRWRCSWALPCAVGARIAHPTWPKVREDLDPL